MFMKSENAYPESGDNMAMAQYSGNNVPYMRGAPVATFKITRRDSSGTYIIRLMTDESLTIAFDGTNVVTKSISTIDSIVALRNTFYITKHSDGYSIRPYSSSDYISATSDHSGVTSGALSDNAKWYIRGYRTFIEEGVYALENLRNTGMWMDTYFNSYERNKNVQQYDYSSSPADSFSRGGLFKVTKTVVDGQYVIRLMTNNLLTWEVQSDNYVKSDYISYDEDEIELNQKYYIVFDNGGFIVVPCNNINKVISALEGSTASGSAGGDDARLRAVQRSEATNSARWLMYKYIGPDRCGADIILPDEIESIGAIVGNTYTISHTVWYTKEDMFDFSVSAIDSSFNDVSFEYDSDNYTATMTVHNLGEISYYVLSKRMVDGVPMMSISADVSFYVIPKEDTYYLQNSQSNLYANVINHSTDNGAIIHQLGFSTDSRFKWEIEHVEDSGGYVLLKSQLSNMYMGVDLDSSSNQTRIRQYEDVGDNTLWRFETLDNGSVKIICKATESSGKVLAAPNVLPGTGEWLTQYTYTDDENCNDEWIISPNRYQFYINHYYDVGYSVRFSSIGEDISEYQRICSAVLSELFDVEIIYTVSTFNSCADTCTVTPITLVDTTTACTHSNINHKTRSNIMSDIVSIFGTGDDTIAKIAWTGHVLESRSSCSYRTEHVIVITIGMVTDNYNNNLSTDKIRSERIYTLLHEISHQIGASDHYCYDETSSDCDNPNNDCWRCDHKLDYMPVCIMSSRISDIEDRLLEGNLDTLYCSQCKSSTHLHGILTHLEDHH